MSIQTASTDACALYDERDIRAATESMTVVHEGRGNWTVYSGETSEYDVFLVGDEWKCECADHHYRGNLCKHSRRVQMLLGERPVPELSRATKTDVEHEMDSRARIAETEVSS